jgi:tRNA (cytidine/uridine-2'-O-)-methyltransferase
VTARSVHRPKISINAAYLAMALTRYLRGHHCCGNLCSVLHIVLVEPEIPPNTGNIARLCVAAGAGLHLVEPLGFSLEDKFLRRAGMDYWNRCDVRIWRSFAELCTASPNARFLFFTKKTCRPYWDHRFERNDYLVFGRETKGLPESLLERNASNCLTIPMREEARSLNLATAAGIVLYEAVRQLRIL